MNSEELRTATWSGIPVERIYGPDAPDERYRSRINAAGEYPFTRGIYPGMYRDRLWITRQLCGLEDPVATNERIRYLVQHGQMGLAIVPDTPTQLAIDSDDGRAEGSVGTQGVPLCTVQDMRDMLAGIGLTDVTCSFSIPGISASVLLGQLVVVAEDAGIPLRQLRGSFQNDPIQAVHCGYDYRNPLDMLIRVAIDNVEFCYRHMENWHPIVINAYDLRESGLSAVDEVAMSVAIGIAYVEQSLQRGIPVEWLARKISVISGCHVDFFEEVAKFRAFRRVWAHVMHERFGCPRERAKLTIAVHTSGSSLVAEQPINNVVRGTVEAMAAILGGCAGLDISSYDEGVTIPSEAASFVALRTQQVLRLETGITKTVDPLGGSYYLERLTDEIEERALEAIREVDAQGGMIEAAKSGWFASRIANSSNAVQAEIDEGKRLIVGHNIHRIPPEEDNLLPMPRKHPEPCTNQMDRVRRFKEERDGAKVEAELQAVRATSESGANVIGDVVSAVRSGATVGELVAAIRSVYQRQGETHSRGASV